MSLVISPWVIESGSSTRSTVNAWRSRERNYCERRFLVNKVRQQMAQNTIGLEAECPSHHRHILYRHMLNQVPIHCRGSPPVRNRVQENNKRENDSLVTTGCQLVLHAHSVSRSICPRLDYERASVAFIIGLSGGDGARVRITTKCAH